MGVGLQAPFPYFGGKRNVAELVWQLLGDPGGYVEPFAGSAAVLLRRPEVDGPRVETLNDKDGWLVNMWRAIKYYPEETAEHAAGPVTEIDYHARLAWLQMRRDDHLVSLLEGDPEWCDPKAAGWWLYVAACGIGNPFKNGPWVVVDDRLVDTRKQRSQKPVGGVTREIPHLGSGGQGISSARVRGGVTRELPAIGSAGRGVMSFRLQQQGITEHLSLLAQRLTNVRIVCGDWQRVLTNSASQAKLTARGTAIFLDPPYATSGDLYVERDGHQSIATEVREWCLEQNDPNRRIVLCGYDDEHDALLEYGWSKHVGRRGSAGMGNERRVNRERLWASPNCLTPHQT